MLRRHPKLGPRSSNAKRIGVTGSAPSGGRLGYVAFVALGVAIGSLNALQARVNGELGFAVGDSFVAALLSIGSGLVLIAIALAFSRAGRAGVRSLPGALRERRLAWWHVLGGISGAYYAIAQTVTGLLLGVALFSVAIVAGQTLSSLLMDRLGVGPGGTFALSAPRLIGTGLVLVAVMWSVGGQLDADAPVLWAWMPLLAGIGMGWQLAVNGRVRVETNSVVAATFLNFALAAALLSAIVLGRWALGQLSFTLDVDPWLLSGGVLGSLFIAGSALVVKRIGVLVLGIAVVAGQLCGALVVDLVSPSPIHPLTTETLVGVALALIAVVISGLRTTRPPRVS